MAFLYLLKQEWIYASNSDKFKIILIILFHTLSNLGIVLFPLAFKGLINSLTTKTHNTGIGVMFYWMGMLFLCFLLFEVFHRLARFIEYSVGGRVRENCVDRLYRHVYSLPLGWHQAHHSGNTINRVRLASESLFTFITYQFTFIGTVILSLGPFISLFFVSRDTAVIIGFLIVCTILVNHKFDKVLVQIIRTKNERIHTFTAILFDFISNIETLITLGIGRQTEHVLKEKSQHVSFGHREENNYNQLKCQVMSILGFILQIGLTGYFIFTRWEIPGIITIGTVIQVHQYCTLIKNSTMQFSGSYFDLVKWATDFSSVEKILHTPVVRNEFNQVIDNNWKTLEIKDMCFHYHVSVPDQKRKHKYVLKDFTLSLTNQSKIAITGASGSGKSTFFKLLRGLYIPDTVTLIIDSKENKDLRALSPRVTLIPQLPDIFENTIRYNITLGISICKNELETILHTAGLEPVLARLKYGLDSDIREKGVNLSGGERQRIALARGLLAAKDSSIILLDEVTSNIDMALEKKIFKRIFTVYKDRCIIASVHRLYLLKLFDSVYSLIP